MGYREARRYLTGHCKKTPQTPPTEIALALARLKEVNNG